MSQIQETSILGLELRKMSAWAKNLTLIFTASLLIGLFAHVSIPLPFTPIPIATQGSVVLLLGVLLGAKRTVGAVLVFLIQGALGLPVFSGGAFGVDRLMGPRAGYFIGYLVAAYVVGRLVEFGGKRTLMNAFLAMFAGNVMIFLFGSFVLSFYIGAPQALLLGVLPFVVGDLVKIGLSLSFLKYVSWVQK